MSFKSGIHRFFLGFFLLFCGVLIGASGTAIIGSKLFLHRIGDPDAMHAHALEHLQRRLDLTETQRGRIEGILRERLDTMHRLRSEMRPRLLTELRMMEEEVSAVLDESQRETWRKHFERLRKLLHLHDSDTAEDERKGEG